MKAKRTDNKEINDFVSIEERILQLVREASETDWENNRWVILGYPSPKEVKTLIECIVGLRCYRIPTYD